MTKTVVTIFENWPKTPNKAWLKNIEKQLQNNFQRYTYLWNFLSNSLIDGTESCAPILVTEIAAASLANSIQVNKSIPCDKPVAKALSDLRFSKKRVAKDVSSCLQSAIANAENNHGLDVDELVVQSAYVGKNMVLKRGRPRARGRYGRILKPFSQITIVVRENREKE